MSNNEQCEEHIFISDSFIYQLSSQSEALAKRV